MNSEQPPRAGREITGDMIRDWGYVAARKLPDGRWMAVAKMYLNGRLYFDLSESGAEGVYCYTSVEHAWIAMMAFDPAVDDEPQGWHKDPVNNRVRPDGDKSKETIGYPYPD